MKTLCAVAILFVGFMQPSSAFAKKKYIPAITEERNAATGFALTADLVTASLAATCGQVPALKADADAARASWKQRNGELVNSAHQYLLLVRTMYAQEHGDDAAKAFYEEQVSEFEMHTRDTLQDRFPQGRPDAEICNRTLNAISGGGLDLTRRADFHKPLLEIKTDMAQLYEP